MTKPAPLSPARATRAKSLRLHLLRLIARGRDQRGSAITEAAIVIPVLVLIIYWSAAMTEVMVLKIKSAEALRFALWESTVFRSSAQIDTDLATRFSDLRSPETLKLTNTGLMLYPQAANVKWSANVNSAYKKVGFGVGNADPPAGAGPILKWIYQVLSLFGRGLDSAVARQKFNVFGEASAQVTLVRASHIGSAVLNGGDLIGDKGRGGQDLDHPGFMANFTFQSPLKSEHPMRLVFDTWKAWPKPAQFTFDGGGTNTAISPMQSYPEVEQQVSAQVGKIAFFGLKQTLLGDVSNFMAKVFNTGIMRTILGGNPPDILGTTTMDGKNGGQRGPITILPVEKPDVNWVPGNGLNTQRVGDVGTSGIGPIALSGKEALSDGEDRTRYTVPYRINTRYWTSDGGTGNDTLGASLATPPANVNVTRNGYTDTFRCRGHYFSGSYKPQITDWKLRYHNGCN